MPFISKLPHVVIVQFIAMDMNQKVNFYEFYRYANQSEAILLLIWISEQTFVDTDVGTHTARYVTEAGATAYLL